MDLKSVLIRSYYSRNHLMASVIKMLFIAALLGSSSLTFAQPKDADTRWRVAQSVGVGGFASRSAFRGSNREVRFRGASLMYSLAISSYVALRAKACFADLDGGFESDVELSAFGGDFLLGVNLNRPGFRAYIGPGIDAQKLTFADNFAGSREHLDEDNARRISSFVFNAGLGYRYNKLILDVGYAQNLGDKDSDVWTDIQPRQPKKVNGVPVLDVNGDPVYEPVDAIEVSTSSWYFTVSYVF